MKRTFQRYIKYFLLQYRRPFIVLFHVGLIVIAYYFSFSIRFDFVIPPEYYAVFQKTLPLLIVVKIIVFYYFGIFHGLWRYLSISDLWQIIKANIVATLVFITFAVFYHGLTGFPRSIFLADFIACTSFISSVRLFARLLKEKLKNGYSHKQKKVLIVGGGEAGILTLKELRNNPHMGKVVGFIDDDPVKRFGTIHGVKVLGKREDIKDVVEYHEIEEIILAIPSANGEIIRQIISYCQIPDIKLKIVPGFQKILSGALEIKPREVKPEDLLGRETVQINKNEVTAYLKGKSVLVTGAGGSIGSEICRQIVSFEPAEIVLFDYNENDVYFLLVELKTKFPHQKVSTVIGDIKDVSLLKQTFSQRKPQVVFHAAAHKHVPLMEDNPAAAVKNNIIGSRNLIYAAHHYGVECFVLISTDKAVNPINVMGMSKRIAEMMLQAKAKVSKTKFIAVRFGNVIGSAGSVVPLFKKQIEEGGPVTVAHPEAKRYFMSVKEAVLLVLQAGFIGNGGEIFILDMGEQIKILDIAKDLITLSGFTLDKDISIAFTGLRPGEKLSEELLLDKEEDRVTKHQKIYISHSEGFDPQTLRGRIKELERLTRTMNHKAIVYMMGEIIADQHLSEAPADEKPASNNSSPAVPHSNGDRVAAPVQDFHQPEPDPV